MPDLPAVGSASIAQPRYWWYQARESLLRTALSRYVGEPTRVLDVGSADGPSVRWLRGPEGTALDELGRVLAPGGRVLMSVPAYQWAWTHFDDVNGHHRRYTRARAVAAVRAHGLVVERSTYAFLSTFPMFAAERLALRLRERAARSRPQLAAGEVPPLPQVPAPVERVLMALCRLDQWLLVRFDLPFGSSVLLAATKPRR